MNPSWYVLRSKPNKELALWLELRARGFETFYPQLHVRPVNPRSRKVRPYFPGYLFVQADLEQVGISTFQWMPFSVGFVAFDDIPAVVADSVVHTLRRHLDEINAAGIQEIKGLQPGDPVVVQGGPFDGYEGILDVRLPGTERVRVLLRLLRDRRMSVELPEAQIQIKKRR